VALKQMNKKYGLWGKVSQAASTSYKDFKEGLQNDAKFLEDAEENVGGSSTARCTI